jgi:hypothetical protein
MPVTINGDGSITGLSVGGLPNGTVDADTLASNAVTTAKIANDAVTADKASGTAKGLTMVDHWRKDSQVTGNQSPITGWERVDTHFSLQGSTGMTESSGVWTFPESGLYLVTYVAHGYLNGTTSYIGLYFFYSTDGGSSYNSDSLGHAYCGAAGSGYNGGMNQHVINVTDASTFRFRIYYTSSNSSSCILQGHSSRTLTGITFIRLGDAG